MAIINGDVILFDGSFLSAGTQDGRTVRFKQSFWQFAFCARIFNLIFLNVVFLGLFTICCRTRRVRCQEITSKPRREEKMVRREREYSQCRDMTRPHTGLKSTLKSGGAAAYFMILCKAQHSGGVCTSERVRRRQSRVCVWILANQNCHNS